MKIQTSYKKWNNIKKVLVPIRIPDTIKGKKTPRLFKNYVIALEPPAYYPRLHIMVKQSHKFVTLDIHVDINPHDSLYIHKRIDAIINMLKNS